MESYLSQKPRWDCKEVHRTGFVFILHTHATEQLLPRREMPGPLWSVFAMHQPDAVYCRPTVSCKCKARAQV